MEIWKAIPGFEGLYEVSDQGRVRSLDRVVTAACKWGGQHERTYRGRVLIQTVANRYLRVRPSVGDEVVDFLVHRLVLATFVGPCPAGHQVRHLDGNTRNNQLQNLAYGTPEENSADKAVHGTDMPGEKNHQAKLTNDAVRHIRSSSLSGKELAKMLGVSDTAVYYARNRKTWRHV